MNKEELCKDDVDKIKSSKNKKIRVVLKIKINANDNYTKK